MYIIYVWVYIIKTDVFFRRSRRREVAVSYILAGHIYIRERIYTHEDMDMIKDIKMNDTHTWMNMTLGISRVE